MAEQGGFFRRIFSFGQKPEPHPGGTQPDVDRRAEAEDGHLEQLRVALGPSAPALVELPLAEDEILGGEALLAFCERHLARD